MAKTTPRGNDVVDGLAIGAASHGLGAAALSSQPLKFAAAIVSMTLTGLWTVLLLTLPRVKATLMKMALPAISLV